MNLEENKHLGRKPKAFDKFQACQNNDVKLIYYTNLKEKAEENDFYSNKIIFYDKNNLRKFLNSYETAN